MRMGHKKTQHLPGRIGPARISVGTGEAATGPSVARAVNDPLLENRPSVHLDV